VSDILDLGLLFDVRRDASFFFGRGTRGYFNSLFPFSPLPCPFSIPSPPSRVETLV